MKTTWKTLAFLLLVSVAGLPSSPAKGQAAPEEDLLPEEARHRLDYAIGSWRSESQRLGAQGEVIKTSYSEDERRFVIEDRVIEISGKMLETGRRHLAWEYFDVRSGKYSLTSIERNGRVTTLSGDLSEPFRWTSATRETPDGRSYAMRFTHTDIKPDSFTALGELSFDGGETWTAFSRQLLTRQGE